MSSAKKSEGRGNEGYLERMAVLGEMFAEAAHEINNLLGAACAYLELEANRQPRESSYLNTTEALVRLAADLTSNVLHFAGPVSGDAGDVREAVGAALGLFNYRTRHRTHVTVELPDDLPAVTVSTGNLLLVLINLVKNALDALESEVAGEVRVTGRRVGSSVEIRVWNSGPPIHPPILSRLFSRRVTTKAAAGGSGLGLSIVRRLVEEAGGTIRGANVPDGGVAFTFTLPVSATASTLQLAARQPPEREPGPTPLRGMRILVVDDDDSMREVLQLVLSQMGGGHVQSCSSGEEALQRLKIEQFDAVVLDLRMPGLSGQSTFERMSPGVRRRVVFITGDVLRVTTSEFLSLSRQPALIKPVAHSDLVEAIRRVTRPPERRGA